MEGGKFNMSATSPSPTQIKADDQRPEHPDVWCKRFGAGITPWDAGKVPDGMLKLGYCQAQLGQKDRARNTFNEVLRLYPMSDAARFAQSQLRAMNLGQ